jgi:hypothetical protein
MADGAAPSEIAYYYPEPYWLAQEGGVPGPLTPVPAPPLQVQRARRLPVSVRATPLPALRARYDRSRRCSISSRE